MSIGKCVLWSVLTTLWFWAMAEAVIACDTASRTGTKAVISAVVDGDTVDVVFGNPPEGCGKKERVRLIGVNTPELTKDPPEYYAEEARDFTDKWWGANVRIVFDRVSSRRDVYGRLLAYVYLEDGTLFNELLIREGCGRYYGNFAFEEERMKAFSLAEEEARKAKKGLWGRALSSRRKALSASDKSGGAIKKETRSGRRKPGKAAPEGNE